MAAAPPPRWHRPAPMVSTPTTGATTTSALRAALRNQDVKTAPAPVVAHAAALKLSAQRRGRRAFVARHCCLLPPGQALCTPVRCILLVFCLSRSVSPSLVLTLSHSLFVSFQTQYPSLLPPVSIPPHSVSLHSPSPLSLSSRRTPAARRTRSCGEGGVEGRGKTKRLRRQRKRGERHSSPPRAAPPHRSRQSP